MATGGRGPSSGNSSVEINSNPSKILCRYYMNGACHLGSNCQFSHDRNNRPSNVCRFYSRGACTYGNRCRYDHVRARGQLYENLPPEPQRAAGAEFPTKVLSCNAAISASSPAAVAGASSSEPDKDWNAYREQMERELGLISLKSINSSDASVVANSKLRADAKEFVPSSKAKSGSTPPSYARAVGGGNWSSDYDCYGVASPNGPILCPYFIMGQCLNDACSYVHGEMCDLCNRPMLYPDNEAKNAAHRQECLIEHEKQMELAFAIAKGEGKECGICMEVVMEKNTPNSRRFGILPGCKHCYCLECIRKWRREQVFENDIIRSCPECRVQSDFIIPSTIWVEEDDEKKALMDAYQASMKDKPCKYFKFGEGECPFGNKCFYRHARLDGTLVEGESPRTIRRRLQQRRRAYNETGPMTGFILLWDFLDVADVSRRYFADSDDEGEWETYGTWLRLTRSDSNDQ